MLPSLPYQTHLQSILLLVHLRLTRRQKLIIFRQRSDLDAHLRHLLCLVDARLDENRVELVTDPAVFLPLFFDGLKHALLSLTVMGTHPLYLIHQLVHLALCLRCAQLQLRLNRCS